MLTLLCQKEPNSVSEQDVLLHNHYELFTFSQAIIYIALLTIQIVSKQLHNIKIGKSSVNNVKWQD